MFYSAGKRNLVAQYEMDEAGKRDMHGVLIMPCMSWFFTFDSSVRWERTCVCVFVCVCSLCVCVACVCLHLCDWAMCLLALKHLVSLEALKLPEVQVDLGLRKQQLPANASPNGAAPCNHFYFLAALQIGPACLKAEERHTGLSHLPPSIFPSPSLS